MKRGGVPSSTVANVPVQAQEEEPEKEVVITKAIPEDIKEVISLGKSLFLLSIPVLLRLCSEVLFQLL